MDKLPLLYTFRRCPYAMRARMALVQANINVEVREIDLKDKHPIFLQTSPKGTVPVLVLPDGKVIEESLDIIAWVHGQDSDWLFQRDHPLIAQNDTAFVRQAMRYKYFERYPESTQEAYREQALFYLQDIEESLKDKPFILSDKASFVDIALFPFIRQFIKVDEAWFDCSPFKALKTWADYWTQSKVFESAMFKYKPYQIDDDIDYLMP